MHRLSAMGSVEVTDHRKRRVTMELWCGGSLFSGGLCSGPLWYSLGSLHSRKWRTDMLGPDCSNSATYL